MELRDGLAPREEIVMQENGSHDKQSSMPKEPQHLPQWADHAKGEGPIETAGTNPTPVDPNPIPPAKGQKSEGARRRGKGSKEHQGRGAGRRA